MNDYVLSIERSAELVRDVVTVDVYIADNTFENIRAIEFRSCILNIRVFPFHENIGYFGAVGRMMCNIDLSLYDYVIISNVDLLMDNDTIKSLIGCQLKTNVGWIAPQIYSQQEKRDRNPKIIKRYSLKKLKLIRMFYKIPVLHYIYTKTLYKSKKLTTYRAGEIYAGHGSFIILTKEYFKRCGMIDYPVFLFGEEIYLAEMCRMNNLKVVYSPDIKIYDMEHISTGTIKPRLYYRYNYEAIDYLIRTFFAERL